MKKPPGRARPAPGLAVAPPPGDGGVGGGELPVPADRAGAGRVAAEPLLVGVDLPGQRPGGAGRAGGRGRAGARGAAPQAAGIDVTGVVSSSAGLAAVTFGLIEAGQDGWSD